MLKKLWLLIISIFFLITPSYALNITCADTIKQGSQVEIKSDASDTVYSSSNLNIAQVVRNEEGKYIVVTNGSAEGAGYVTITGTSSTGGTASKQIFVWNAKLQGGKYYTYTTQSGAEGRKDAYKYVVVNGRNDVNGPMYFKLQKAGSKVYKIIDYYGGSASKNVKGKYLSSNVSTATDYWQKSKFLDKPEGNSYNITFGCIPSGEATVPGNLAVISGNIVNLSVQIDEESEYYIKRWLVTDSNGNDITEDVSIAYDEFGEGTLTMPPMNIKVIAELVKVEDLTATKIQDFSAKLEVVDSASNKIKLSGNIYLSSYVHTEKNNNSESDTIKSNSNDIYTDETDTEYIEAEKELASDTDSEVTDDYEGDLTEISENSITRFKENEILITFPMDVIYNGKNTDTIKIVEDTKDEESQLEKTWSTDIITFDSDIQLENIPIVIQSGSFVETIFYTLTDNVASDVTYSNGITTNLDSYMNEDWTTPVEGDKLAGFSANFKDYDENKLYTAGDVIDLSGTTHVHALNSSKKTVVKVGTTAKYGSWTTYQTYLKGSKNYNYKTYVNLDKVKNNLASDEVLETRTLKKYAYYCDNGYNQYKVTKQYRIKKNVPKYDTQLVTDAVGRMTCNVDITFKGFRVKNPDPNGSPIQTIRVLNGKIYLVQGSGENTELIEICDKMPEIADISTWASNFIIENFDLTPEVANERHYDEAKNLTWGEIIITCHGETKIYKLYIDPIPDGDPINVIYQTDPNGAGTTLNTMEFRKDEVEKGDGKWAQLWQQPNEKYEFLGWRIQRYTGGEYITTQLTYKDNYNNVLNMLDITKEYVFENLDGTTRKETLIIRENGNFEGHFKLPTFDGKAEDLLVTAVYKKIENTDNLRVIIIGDGTLKVNQEPIEDIAIWKNPNAENDYMISVEKGHSDLFEAIPGEEAEFLGYKSDISNNNFLDHMEGEIPKHIYWHKHEDEKIIYVFFTDPNPYTVTYVSNPPEAVTKFPDNKISQKEGSTQELWFEFDSDKYEFKSWAFVTSNYKDVEEYKYDPLTGKGNFSLPAANVVAIANFDEIDDTGYTLYITSTVGGTAWTEGNEKHPKDSIIPITEGLPNGKVMYKIENVKAGEQFIINYEITENNYKFGNWEYRPRINGEESGTQTIITMPKSNTTVTAVFKNDEKPGNNQNPKIRVTSNNINWGSAYTVINNAPTLMTEEYEAQTYKDYVVYFEAADGYYFTGWKYTTTESPFISGITATEGSNNAFIDGFAQIRMPNVELLEIMAMFSPYPEEIGNDVYFEARPEWGGKVPGNMLNVEEGTKIELWVEVTPGCEFNEWTFEDKDKEEVNYTINNEDIIDEDGNKVKIEYITMEDEDVTVIANIDGTPAGHTLYITSTIGGEATTTGNTNHPIDSIIPVTEGLPNGETMYKIENVLPGEQFVITYEVIEDNYSFGYWKYKPNIVLREESGVQTVITMPNSDTTVTAIFKNNEKPDNGDDPRLRVTSNNIIWGTAYATIEGQPTLMTEEYDVKANKTYVVSFEAADGYYFTGWEYTTTESPFISGITQTEGKDGEFKKGYATIRMPDVKLLEIIGIFSPIPEDIGNDIEFEADPENGGTVPDDMENVEPGTRIELIITENDGYTFTGWEFEDANENPISRDINEDVTIDEETGNEVVIDYIIMPDEDMKATAHFGDEDGLYTLYIESTVGGTAWTEGNQNHPKDSIIPITKGLNKDKVMYKVEKVKAGEEFEIQFLTDENYTFNKWEYRIMSVEHEESITNKDGKRKVAGITKIKMPASDLTVTAIFNYDGTVEDPWLRVTSNNIEWGETWAIIDNKVKTVMSEQYDKDDGVAKNERYPLYEEAIETNKADETNYFTGWTYNTEKSPLIWSNGQLYIKMPNTNLEVKGMFSKRNERQGHEVDFGCDPSNGGVVPEDLDCVEEGTMVELWVEPHDGYELKDPAWRFEDSKGNIIDDIEIFVDENGNEYFIMPGYDVKPIAQLRDIGRGGASVTVSVDPVNAGNVGIFDEHGNPKGTKWNKVSEGKSVTVVATKNPGYKFDGWYIYGTQNRVSESLTYQFDMGSRSIHLVAKFIGTFDLTVTARPEEGGNVEIFELTSKGEISHGTNWEDIPSGTKIRVVATENSGYLPLGWFEGNTKKTSNKILEFAIDKDYNLVADFEKDAVVDINFKIVSVRDLRWKNYFTTSEGGFIENYFGIPVDGGNETMLQPKRDRFGKECVHPIKMGYAVEFELDTTTVPYDYAYLKVTPTIVDSEGEPIDTSKIFDGDYPVNSEFLEPFLIYADKDNGKDNGYEYVYQRFKATAITDDSYANNNVSESFITWRWVYYLPPETELVGQYRDLEELTVRFDIELYSENGKTDAKQWGLLASYPNWNGGVFKYSLTESALDDIYNNAQN